MASIDGASGWEGREVQDNPGEVVSSQILQGFEGHDTCLGFFLMCNGKLLKVFSNWCL